MAARRPGPLGRRLGALMLLALVVAVRRRRCCPLRRRLRHPSRAGHRSAMLWAAPSRPRPALTLARPPGLPRSQAPLADARRPLQAGTALGQPAATGGAFSGNTAGQQAVAAAVQQVAVQQQQQQQQQQVDQLEGEQPQVQVAQPQQPLAAAQQQQQIAQQQQAFQATQQQQQQQQAAGASSVDDLFLCQDKLANATIVEQLPQLKIEQMLNSNKPRSPQDVTLVTQLSFERWVLAGGAGGGRGRPPPVLYRRNPRRPVPCPALALPPAHPNPTPTPPPLRTAGCTCWRGSATCGTASSPPPSTSRCSTARR